MAELLRKIRKRTGRSQKEATKSLKILTALALDGGPLVGGFGSGQIPVALRFPLHSGQR
jgi:hypothetical protein